MSPVSAKRMISAWSGLDNLLVPLVRRGLRKATRISKDIDASALVVGDVNFGDDKANAKRRDMKRHPWN